MTTEKEPKEEKVETNNIRVVDAVIAKIGKPENYDRGIAKHLWADRYRVNIWVAEGKGFCTAKRIVNSYFVRHNGKELVSCDVSRG